MSGIEDIRNDQAWLIAINEQMIVDHNQTGKYLRATIHIAEYALEQWESWVRDQWEGTSFYDGAMEEITQERVLLNEIKLKTGF